MRTDAARVKLIAPVEIDSLAESIHDVVQMSRLIATALRRLQPSALCDELAAAVEHRAQLIEARLPRQT
jgi:hypothetical protein